jgi:hypothetical protein
MNKKEFRQEVDATFFFFFTKDDLFLLSNDFCRLLGKAFEKKRTSEDVSDVLLDFLNKFLNDHVFLDGSFCAHM